MNDEADFWHADKNEKLLQIDTMILMDMAKHFQSFQNSKCSMSVQYHKKEDRDKLIFCMQISIKIAFNTLRTKVGYKVIL